MMRSSIKRALTAWAVAVALALSALPAMAGEDVTEIWDIAGLQAMAGAPHGRYRLMDDIVSPNSSAMKVLGTTRNSRSRLSSAASKASRSRGT